MVHLEFDDIQVGPIGFHVGLVGFLMGLNEDLMVFSTVSSRLLKVRVLWGRVFKGTKWSRVFCGMVLGILSREGFASLLGLLGSSRLGFFRERFSSLVVCEVFLIFAIFFVRLALGGGLLGVNFFLCCWALFL